MPEENEDGTPRETQAQLDSRPALGSEGYKVSPPSVRSVAQRSHIDRTIPLNKCLKYIYHSCFRFV